MSTQSDIAAIKGIVARLDQSRASKLSYTDAAFNDDLIEGVAAFDVNAEQNVPLAGLTDFNETVRAKGVRTQGASLPRMSINHFFGRLSYNLNKLIQKFAAWMDIDIASRAHNSNEYDPSAPYRTGDVCYITEVKDGVKTMARFTRTSTVPETITGIPVTNSTHWGIVLGKESGRRNKYTIADLTGPSYDNTLWYPVTTKLFDFLCGGSVLSANRDTVVMPVIEAVYNDYVDPNQSGDPKTYYDGIFRVQTCFNGQDRLNDGGAPHGVSSIIFCDSVTERVGVDGTPLPSQQANLVGYSVLSAGGQCVLWLKGGVRYSIWNSHGSEFTLHTSLYDNGVDVPSVTYSGAIEPTAGRPDRSWYMLKRHNVEMSASQLAGVEPTSEGVKLLTISRPVTAASLRGIPLVYSYHTRFMSGSYVQNSISFGPNLDNTGTDATLAERNVAIGITAYGVSTADGGTDNTVVGYGALAYGNSGSFNTAVGAQTLASNRSSYMTALGYKALFSNTTGGYNTAVGYQALLSNTTASSNTAVGYNALRANVLGGSNVAVGAGAMAVNYSGVDNTALGCLSLASALYQNGNTAVGSSALYNTTGAQNTAIGAAAGLSLTTGSNNTVIGYNAQAAAEGSANTITLGNGNIGVLRCAVTTITSLSDRRDKGDISDAPFGLDFINETQPRIFHWDKREWYMKKDERGLPVMKDGKPVYEKEPDGSRKSKEWALGFIAQELKALQQKYNAGYLNLVMEDNPDRLEATPGNLLPIAVQAIKDLSAKLDSLAAEVKALKGKAA